VITIPKNKFEQFSSITKTVRAHVLNSCLFTASPRNIDRQGYYSPEHILLWLFQYFVWWLFPVEQWTGGNPYRSGISRNSNDL